jgi:hypothetical protein
MRGDSHFGGGGKCFGQKNFSAELGSSYLGIAFPLPQINHPMTASLRRFSRISIPLLLVRATRFTAAILLWLLTASSVQAQPSLTGLVLDQQQKAIPFASVILKIGSSPAKVVQAVLTDERGHFTILSVRPGGYELQVQQLGYAIYSQAVQVTVGSPTLDLGSLTLQAAAQNLTEVVVTGRKPLLEQKPDRVIMNVENSLLAAGNSAYDILSMAPSVQLLDGQVILRGKSNVLILLNGKPLPRGTSLETILAAIPGDQIEHIELITNPSSRYDASASGGVIEIYTKRAKELGWTANLGINFRQGQRSGAGLNGGLRVSSPKFDFVASGSGSRRGGFERNTAHRTYYNGRSPTANLSQGSDLDKILQDASLSRSHCGLVEQQV